MRRSSLGVFDLFSESPADHNHKVLARAPRVKHSLVLSEHGPCLVGDTITLSDASFTTKIMIHSGAGVLAPFGCVALLDTGSLQTFIQRDGLDRVLSVGAASITCEQKCVSRSWGRIRPSEDCDERAPERPFVRENERTCSLAV